MLSDWFPKQGVSSKQLNNIKPFLQETKDNTSIRMIESLQQILNFYFGSPDKSGILRRFGNQFYNYQTMQWVIELQRLLQHIGPYSSTLDQLIYKSNDPNSHIVISKMYLPNTIQPSYFDRNKIFNIRIMPNGIILSTIDAFTLMLVYQVYHTQTINIPTTHYQHLVIDQFYSSCTCNPVLVLFRRCLEYFTTHYKKILQKVLQLVRIYFFDEIVTKYELDFGNKLGYQDRSNNQSDSYLSYNSRKSVQLKYKIKTHHMHAIYLCLRYCDKPFTYEFSKYSQAVFQYYSSLRPQRNCLQAFIRVWIYGMSNNNQNIQNEVIYSLKQKANSKQGWFLLKRYSPTSVISTEKTLNVYNTATALNILKTIQKQAYWSANPAYLWTFACFFNFLNSTNTFYSQLTNVRRGSQSRNNSTAEKVFRMIVESFDKSMVDIMNKIKVKNSNQFKQSLQKIQQYQNIIKKYYTNYLRARNFSIPNQRNLMQRQVQSQLPKQFCFKPFKQEDLKFAQKSNQIVSHDHVNKDTIQSKRNLVSFYRRQPKGCWQIPIQYNQSTILFYLWYTIAKIIDLIVPGKRSYPFLNIRFLANPITLIGLLIVFFISYLIFK